MASVLFDRDRELDILSDALASARAGDGTVALISGEAGIGKTTLLTAFLERLDPIAHVFRGACEDLSVAEPMGPLRDIIREAGPAVSDDLGDGGSLLTLFAELIAFCANTPSGSVLVIEDFHWADDATVDFVRYVARRISDHPILFLVTSRIETVESRQRVRKAFGDLPAERLIRLPLSALSKQSVATLCQNTWLDPDEVYEASRGNAFFVTELLRSSDDSLPASVRDAVLARADRLTDSGQRMAELVSIFPRRAEIDHVLALGGEEAEAGLECCLDAGLLGLDGSNVFFAHELAREAVLSSVSPLRQRTLNGALYQRLTETGETALSRVVHHAQEAGNRDAVAELAPRAARAAARLESWPEAATFFDLAVETLGDAADVDLLEDAAWASYLSTGHVTAATYQKRAVDLIDPTQDPVHYGMALRKLARFYWLRSDFIEAEATAKAAIEALADEDGPELALAHSTLSQLYMAAYRFEEVWPHAEKAMALAKAHDRPDILCHALNNYAMSHSFADYAAARGYIERSLEIALEIDNADHAGRAMSNSMHLEYETCHYREAVQRAERSATYSREREMDGYYRYALGMYARAKMRLCDWDAVGDAARRGFDPDDLVPVGYHANAALALFHHSVRMGQPAPEGTLEYLTLFDTEVAEAQRLAPFAEAVAERAWQEGDNLTDAIALLYRAVASATLSETVGNVLIWLKRLGEDVSVEGLDRFPAPFGLELSGDQAGAAAAWAERGATYDQALALAFGEKAQRAEAAQIFKRLGHGPDPARFGMPGDAPKRGRPSERGPFGLTRRQIDVLKELDRGKSNSEIGEALFISPKTVDHHVSAILAALDVPNRGAAAAKAREVGLI